MNAKQITTLFLLHLILIWPAATAQALSITNSDRMASPGQNSITLDIVTDEDTTAEVKYGTSTSSIDKTEKDDTSSKLHTITLQNLSPATRYYYRVVIKNLQGTSKTYPTGTTYVITTLDSNPPHKLSGLHSTSVSRTSASFAWDASLDADTDHYNIYRNDVKKGESKTTAYTDTGLQPSTAYSYKVSSVDKGSNEGPLSDAVQLTTPESDTVQPVISELKPSTVAKTSAVISWKTDEEANATLLYGTSESSLGLSKKTAAFELSHSISIESLTDGTAYYYKAISCDSSGNCASSAAKSFTAGSDVEAPVIDITVPEYHNALEMDISGKTEPLSLIYLYVNDRLSAFKATDNTGQFTLRALSLSTSKQNALRFEAEDQSGNKATKAFTVTLDLAKPQVTIAEIPEVTAQPVFAVNGTVNENVKIISKVGDALEKETTSVANKFSLALELKEGDNAVLLKFIDNAGNVQEFTKKIVLDTTPPEIVEPTDLTYYSPSYSAGVKLQGKVDTPGATVIAVVNERTSSQAAIPTSISAIVDYFTQLGDTYSAVADENGNFEINIMLTRLGYEPGSNLSRTGMRAGEVGGTATVGGAGYESWSEQDFTRNKVKLIAIDRTGMQSKPLEGIIEYRLCGTGGAWNVVIKDVSPGAVQSELLMRGIAKFGFNMDLKYQGAGTDASISSKPRMTVYDVSAAEEEQRKHGQLVTTPVSTWSDDMKTGHFIFRLRKWPGSYEELEKVNFLKFPMLLEFDYSYDLYGKREVRTQKQCVDISIQLEKPISEGHIPEHFLKESVKWLEKGVENLELAIGYLDQLQTYLTWACLGSWVVLFLNDILMEVQCAQADKDLVKGELAKLVEWPSMQNVKTCENAESEQSKCEKCAKSKKTSRDLKSLSNYICDRVFCPSVPTIEQHAATYNDPDLAGVGNIDSACQTQQVNPNFIGPVQAPASEQSTFIGPIDITSTTSQQYLEGCKKEYKREWESACLLMDEWKKATEPVDTTPGFLERLFGSSSLCKLKTDETTRWMRTTVNGEAKVFVTENGKLYEAEPKKGGTIPDKDQAFTVSGADQYQKKTGAKPLVVKYNAKTGKPADRFLYEANEDGTPGKQTNIEHNEDMRREVEKPRKYIVNPTEGILRSLQCFCLPAFIGYLTLWKNIMNVVKKCFQSILITKKAESGVCKAFLTVYVCDLIYDAIRCVFKLEGATPGEGGRGGAVGTLASAVSGAADNIQKSAETRYGKSSIYQTMFSERKLVHAVCIAAFTGDWDIDLSTMMQADFTVPIESEVSLWPATRRYITYDPTRDGLTTWIYHMGIGIVAGSKIDWTLDLICSNTNTCENSGNPNNACDCALGRSPKEERYTAASGHLESGETFGDSEEGDNYFEVTEPYRYDKAILTYTYVDNNAEQQTKTIIRSIQLIGASPPAECKFDAIDFMFRCSFILGESGRGGFTMEPKLKKDGLTVNDNIKLSMELVKRSPGYNEADEGSVEEQIPKWLGYRLLNQDNVAIGTTATGEGGWTYLQLVRDGVYSDERPKGDEFAIDILPDDYKIQKDAFQRRTEAAKGLFEFYNVKELKLLFGRPDTKISQPVSSPEQELKFMLSVESKLDNVIKCKIQEVETFTPEGNNATNIKLKTEKEIFDCSKNTLHEYKGITFSFPSSNPVEGGAVIVNYIPPSQAAKSLNICQRYTKANPAKWTVEVALYDAEKINKDNEFTASNAKRSSTVSAYKSKKQSFSVPVKVYCVETAPGEAPKEEAKPAEDIAAVIYIGTTPVSLSTNEASPTKIGKTLARLEVKTKQSGTLTFNYSKEGKPPFVDYKLTATGDKVFSRELDLRMPSGIWKLRLELKDSAGKKIAEKDYWIDIVIPSKPVSPDADIPSEFDRVVINGGDMELRDGIIW